MATGEAVIDGTEMYGDADTSYDEEHIDRSAEFDGADQEERLAVIAEVAGRAATAGEYPVQEVSRGTAEAMPVELGPNIAFERRTAVAMPTGYVALHGAVPRIARW